MSNHIWRYSILAGSHISPPKAGQVMVAGYYDVESDQTLIPLSKGKSAVGKNYLGSEVDYIIKKNVEKNRFGLYKNVFYEADQ